MVKSPSNVRRSAFLGDSNKAFDHTLQVVDVMLVKNGEMRELKGASRKRFKFLGHREETRYCMALKGSRA